MRTIMNNFTLTRTTMKTKNKKYNVIKHVRNILIFHLMKRLERKKNSNKKASQKRTCVYMNVCAYVPYMPPPLPTSMSTLPIQTHQHNMC